MIRRHLHHAFLLTILPFGVASAQQPTVRIDPRIELTTIVFRMIEAMEYNQCRVPTYAADIDRHFAPYRNHPAVKLASELRESKNIGFDAVPSLAIALTDPPKLAERVRVGDQGEGIGDRRWGGPHARQFIAALRQFAVDSRFEEFAAAHAPLYDTTAVRMRRFFDTEVEWEWFARFFGEPPQAGFFAVPAPCNGGANYGPRITPTGGSEERYAILGITTVDTAGWPVIDRSGLSTVIHEFNHSYVNPLVERHRADFESAGKRLMADSTVRELMAARAYADWETVVKESLVRAAVVRYLRAAKGDSAARRELTAQAAFGFLWLAPLDSALGRYEQDRARHPRLESYLPELTKVLDASARDIEGIVQRFDATRPQIVVFSPGDGSGMVDPADSVITVRFDRPMGRGVSFNAGPLGQEAFPKVLGQSFDSTGTTLTIRVALQPATQYQLRFFGAGFRSRDGVPLADRLYTFRTR